MTSRTSPIKVEKPCERFIYPPPPPRRSYSSVSDVYAAKYLVLWRYSDVLPKVKHTCPSHIDGAH